MDGQRSQEAIDVELLDNARNEELTSVQWCVQRWPRVVKLGAGVVVVATLLLLLDFYAADAPSSRILAKMPPALDDLAVFLDADDDDADPGASRPDTDMSTRCSDIPIPEHYWSMSGTMAFVDIPQTDGLVVGDSTCVRVVVPKRENPEYSMTFWPFPNTPWDSVLLDMAGESTGISIPVALEMANHTNNYIRDRSHVYEANVSFRDVDTFVPSGYIEYRDAKWNGEGHEIVVPMVPEELRVPLTLRVEVEDTADSPYDLQKYPDLPLCTEPEADGRWIAMDRLPFNASWTLLPDENNRVFLPYNCRLQRYSYQEFTQCLADKHRLVHWYGDSNTRRALKKFTTLGKWCSTPEEQRNNMCMCHDNVGDFGGLGSGANVVPIDMNPLTGGNVPSIERLGGEFIPANQSRITMFKWGGLTTWKTPYWDALMVDEVEKMAGHPSVVILAAINWDVGLGNRGYFTQQVDRLLDQVEHSYQPDTHIVIRTGQYYCCTHDQDAFYKRKFSRLRYQHFNDYFIQAFQARFGSTRTVTTWDVSRVAETRPYQDRADGAKACAPNHVRAELIEVENQLLMNHLCNPRAIA